VADARQLPWIVAASRAGGGLGRNVLGGQRLTASLRESAGRLRIVSAKSPARAWNTPCSAAKAPERMAGSGGGAFGQNQRSPRVTRPAGGLEAAPRSCDARPPRTSWTNVTPPRLTHRLPRDGISRGRACDRRGPGWRESSPDESRVRHRSPRASPRARRRSRIRSPARPRAATIPGRRTRRSGSRMR